jgi:hypothetical protein
MVSRCFAIRQCNDMMLESLQVKVCVRIFTCDVVRKGDTPCAPAWCENQIKYNSRVHSKDGCKVERMLRTPEPCRREATIYKGPVANSIDARPVLSCQKANRLSNLPCGEVYICCLGSYTVVHAHRQRVYENIPEETQAI